MTEKIEIQLPEDVMKRLKAIAAVDGKDVAEVTEKVVSLYVGHMKIWLTDQSKQLTTKKILSTL